MAEGQQREPNNEPLTTGHEAFFEKGFYDDRFDNRQFNTFQNINNIGE